MWHGHGSEHERVALPYESWCAEPAPWIAASERAREARAAADAATRLRHVVILNLHAKGVQLYRG